MNKSTILSNDPAEDIAPVSPFGAVDYGITADDLAKMAEQYSHITQVTTRKEYDAAQAAVTALIRARTKIESRRKELKSESLEFGRLVDTTAKQLIAVVTPEETRIDALIEAVKRQKEAEKAERERIEKERVDSILADIDAIVKLPAAHQRSTSAQVQAAKAALEILLIGESFAEFKARAQEAKDNALAELTELYAGALHDERIEQHVQAERERVAIEQRAEAERLANERAEIARQHEELQAERDRIANEKRVEQERIAEQQRIETKRLEDQRITEAFALAAAEAKARADRLLPDREKVEAFALAIEAVEVPDLSPEVQKYIGELREIIICAARDARDFAGKVCA